MAATESATSTSRELATVAERHHLAPAIAEALVTTFLPFAEQAASLIQQAKGITVTDATQVTEIKAARKSRLALRDIRVLCETARRDMKDESLRKGQAIDAVARYIRERIEPEENRLQEQELFAERAEAARKAKIQAEREAAIRQYTDVIGGYNLPDMTDEQFAAVLAVERKQWERKVAATREADEARLAREKAAAEEQARIRAENDRLRAEAAERERKAAAERGRLKAERDAAYAKAQAERDEAARVAREKQLAVDEALRKEREAREAAEASLAAQRAIEAEAERQRQRAARAPDREKLLAMADWIECSQLPAMASPQGRVAVEKTRKMLVYVAGRIREFAEAV